MIQFKIHLIYLANIVNYGFGFNSETITHIIEYRNCITYQCCHMNVRNMSFFASLTAWTIYLMH